MGFPRIALECEQHACEGGYSMSNNALKAVVQEYIDGVNAVDIERELATVAPDIVVHTPVPGIDNGKQGFRGLMEVYHGAFTEQHVDVRDMLVDGDKVVLLHTHHLVQGGPFLGAPPSGKRAVIDGVEIYRIADGKIAEFWHADDLIGLVQQLGLMPPG